MEIGRMLRKGLRWTGKIPTRHKILYPFWLSAQLERRVEERTLATLPRNLNGLSIAFASDIHYGPLFDRRRAIALIEQINGFQADLVLLGGDYGEDTQTAIQFFRIIPRLKARLGVYCAIGNHDHMGSKEEFRQLLDAISACGANVLMNSCASLEQNGSTLSLCSVDDPKCGKPDFQKTMSGMQAADFRIFLPHSPDVLPLADKHTHFAYDLVLAGHTHGGQIVIRGRSLHSSSRYGDRFRSGWMKYANKDLLVTNGVGTSLLPIRIGARAQIHHITLRAG